MALQTTSEQSSKIIPISLDFKNSTNLDCPVHLDSEYQETRINMINAVQQKEISQLLLKQKLHEGVARADEAALFSQDSFQKPPKQVYIF